MSDRGREPSLVRSIRGPITLITLGVLFAFNNFSQYLPICKRMSKLILLSVR